MVKISVLNDNRCNNNDFLCEHGLSLFIEVDNKRIIFDTGQTDIFIKNASKMNIDLDNTNYIVLSHGDYDHGNGLKYLDIKVPLICHPDIKLTRISKRTGNNNGLNQTEKELKERYELIESKDPFHITPNIIFLGEIERLNDFKKEKNLPATDTYGNTYTFPDDSGLCINTNNGLIVFTGCGHSGICNTIEYAKKITGNNHVYVVIGGFHLREVDEQTLKTINYMKTNNVENILLAHCTSDIVCEEFVKRLGKKVQIVNVGKEYIF